MTTATAGFKGSKFNRDLDTAAIAKLLRADIKQAIAAKALPAGRYSVRISRYAGGSSIDVRIADIAFIVLNRERLAAEITKTADPYALPILSAAGSEVLSRVRDLIQAYNRDDSDSMTDYFSVHFYGNAAFSFEFENAQREAILAQLKAEA